MRGEPHFLALTRRREGIGAANEFDPTNPVGTVRAMSRRYFDGFVAGNDFFAALRLWAPAGPPDDLRHAVADGYRTVQDQIEHLVEGFFEIAGLRMRHPYVPADLAIAWTALTEGFALRLRLMQTPSHRSRRRICSPRA